MNHDVPLMQRYLVVSVQSTTWWTRSVQGWYALEFMTHFLKLCNQANKSSILPNCWICKFSGRKRNVTMVITDKKKLLLSVWVNSLQENTDLHQTTRAMISQDFGSWLNVGGIKVWSRDTIYVGWREDDFKCSGVKDSFKNTDKNVQMTMNMSHSIKMFLGCDRS